MTAAPREDDAARRARLRRLIDRSCRVPCLALFAASVVWLIIGTLLAVLASFKLHEPGFIADVAPLTFGRVRPAHLNVVVYGWASTAGLGVLLWMVCRLSRAPLRWPGVVLAAAGLWNAGVLLGTGAILAGHSQSIEWIEFPPAAAMLLFAGFALTAIWAAMTFAARRERHVYVSQWYLLGAIFWFPWLYAVAYLLLGVAPVGGVTEAAVNWWYGHNVLGVWFTPVGLAAIYYLLPKVIGRPVYSYHLSLLGFWTLALFYNWAGMHHLIGGPVPAWLVTVSIVASMMMFIPVTTVAINHHMTMKGHFHMLRWSPVLRFVVFGGMCYTLVSVQGSLLSLRVINEPFHFSHNTVGHAHLGMYGFFTMTMFGAMYYIIPRLTGREWASAGLIRIHFWCVGLGLFLMVAALTLGGKIQGLEMNQAQAPLSQYVGEHGLIEGVRTFFAEMEARSGQVEFLDIVRGTMPWLQLRSLSGMLIFVGHIAFAVLVALNLAGRGSIRPGPTLLGRTPDRQQEVRE